MHWVYILFSQSKNRYYVGETQDIDSRLEQHNCGLSNYTKSGIPWDLIKVIQTDDRAEARRLERKIKNMGAKRFLKL